MKINDKYESILSEYESNILELEDVLEEDFVRKEIENFMLYLKENKVDIYKKMTINLRSENANKDYIAKVENAIERHIELFDSLIDLHKKENNISNDVALFLKNKQAAHKVNMEFSHLPNVKIEEDEEGKCVDIEKLDVKELENVVRNSVKYYIEESDSDLNADSISSEMIVDIKNEQRKETDDRPVSMNTQTGEIRYKSESWIEEDIGISIKLKGEESAKLDVEDLENIIESVNEDLSFELVDKSYDFNVRAKEKKVKKKRKLKRS